MSDRIEELNQRIASRVYASDMPSLLFSPRPTPTMISWQRKPGLQALGAMVNASRRLSLCGSLIRSMAPPTLFTGFHNTPSRSACRIGVRLHRR